MSECLKSSPPLMALKEALMAVELLFEQQVRPNTRRTLPTRGAPAAGMAQRLLDARDITDVGVPRVRLGRGGLLQARISGDTSGTCVAACLLHEC